MNVGKAKTFSLNIIQSAKMLHIVFPVSLRSKLWAGM